MISKKVRTAAALMAVASISVASARELGPHTSTTIAMERDHGIRTIQVGAATVFALYDGSVPLKAADLLKGESPDTIRAQLRAAGEEEEVVTSINAYLIRAGKRLVLVDTGGWASVRAERRQLDYPAQICRVRARRRDGRIAHAYPYGSFRWSRERR